jgi:YtcA family
VAKIKSTAVVLLVSLGGCSPMSEIGGAYFPAWLLCMIAGLITAAAVRVILIRAKLDPWIRPRALAYPCLGIAVTLLVHLIFFSS